jgi:hypothetical protein
VHSRHLSASAQSQIDALAFAQRHARSRNYKQLPPHRSEFVKYLAQAFDTTTAVPDAFVFCVVVYFAVCGFSSDLCERESN